MLLYGTILSENVKSDFEFVEKGAKVYPFLPVAIDMKREDESVFACLAYPNQVLPPDIAVPGDMSGVLGIQKAKAIILDKKTRSRQSMEMRASFVGMLTLIFKKHTEAFCSVGAPLQQEPFVNPFTMNAVFEIIDSVTSDMADLLGIQVTLPEINVQIQKAPPTILGADGNPTQSAPKIIC